MKKVILGIATLIMLSFSFSGCAALDYMKERKATVCISVAQEKCQAPYKEADASILPYIGDIISPVAEHLLTCVAYGKEDLECREGERKVIIDLIK